MVLEGEKDFEKIALSKGCKFSKENPEEDIDMFYEDFQEFLEESLIDSSLIEEDNEKKLKEKNDESVESVMDDVANMCKEENECRYAKYGSVIVKIKRKNKVVITEEVKELQEKEVTDNDKYECEYDLFKKNNNKSMCEILKNKKFRLTRSQARAYSKLSESEKEKNKKLKNLKKRIRDKKKEKKRKRTYSHWEKLKKKKGRKVKEEECWRKLTKKIS